ncbi:hypothetical protein CMO83_01250 [Candidatus Woesearchaeota archaeon]|nr:hypothetical protein [Candidatus Woesearchaeota archaeon]
MCFLLVIFLFNLVIVNSQPFGPPTYIADPEKMECRYYFAGNERHFNPRPENYTIDIGYTTDFENEGHACEFWRCIYTDGTVKVDQNQRPVENDLCVCNPGHYWDDVFGCVKLKEQQGPITFLQLILGWISGIFR